MNDFVFQIKQAITILSEAPEGVENVELLELFFQKGINTETTKELLIFLPIAFFRRWVNTIAWPDEYLELYEGEDREIERKLSENEFYQSVFKVVDNYFTYAPAEANIQRIGCMSSEFDAINKFLNDGGELGNIVVEKMRIKRS